MTQVKQIREVATRNFNLRRAGRGQNRKCIKDMRRRQITITWNMMLGAKLGTKVPKQADKGSIKACETKLDGDKIRGKTSE